MAADTGSANLPDIGTLSYNGVLFSSLYESKVSGSEVLDNAGRTVKYMKYRIEVDGVVTLDDDVFAATVDHQWKTQLRDGLTKQAGVLQYTGKGFGSPFIVNQPGGTLFDVAWGPIPEILDFVPLGASRSARIKFVVTTCIPEVQGSSVADAVLQFNEQTRVSYNSDGFSSISIRGTLEMPLTRPRQPVKILTRTVDDLRQQFLQQIASGFDLTRFQVVRRDLEISRDKRTLEWDFQLEELPWMGLPGGMLDADGSVTLRPFKPVTRLQGSVQWIATMRATYVVPNGQARRIAWLAFLALWNFRMRQSEFGNLPQVASPTPPAFQRALSTLANAYQTNYQNRVAGIVSGNLPNSAHIPKIYRESVDALASPGIRNKSFPMSLTYDEGLYRSSKTITFEATWQIMTYFDMILIASGLWRKTGLEGGRFWAQSIANISGSKSWLENKLDPTAAAIVDFGG